MKKILNTVLIFTSLLFLIACNKNNTPDSSSDQAEDSETVETTSEAETTIEIGLVPNSAGIIVREDGADFKPYYEITVRTDIPEDEKGLGAAIEDSYYADEDAKRLGVSKILVMQLDIAPVLMPEREIFSKINELLVTKYGCDFVVSFVGLHEDVTSIWNYQIDVNSYTYVKEYYDNLKYIKENKQQADIITAVYTDEGYSTMINEGFFEDITDYLTNTEEGNKLYNAFPEEVWESITRGGRIYGYTKGNLHSGFRGTLSVLNLNCNKAVAEKLGVEVRDNFSFYDIGDILENAKLSEETAEEIVLLYTAKEYLYRMLGYYDVGCGVFAKKDDEGNWIAFNGMEDEAFIRLWKVLRTYKEKGWLRTDRDSKVAATKGEALFSVYNYKLSYNGIDKYPLGEEKDKIALEADEGKAPTSIYDVVMGETYYGYMEMREDVYGVAAWSEYKAEALKLITLLNTEPELANLWKYGLEGVHYEYEDENNKIIFLRGDYQVAARRYAPVNHLITYPIYLEPDNKLDFYKEEYANFEKSPFFEYEIVEARREELQETYDPKPRETLNQIYKQAYAKLMGGLYEDVDAAVAEIKRIQKEAGIDEYIAAINAEFENGREKQVGE